MGSRDGGRADGETQAREGVEALAKAKAGGAGGRESRGVDDGCHVDWRCRPSLLPPFFGGAGRVWELLSFVSWWLGDFARGPSRPLFWVGKHGGAVLFQGVTARALRRHVAQELVRGRHQKDGQTAPPRACGRALPRLPHESSSCGSEPPCSFGETPQCGIARGCVEASAPLGLSLACDITRLEDGDLVSGLSIHIGVPIVTPPPSAPLVHTSSHPSLASRAPHAAGLSRGMAGSKEVSFALATLTESAGQTPVEGGADSETNDGRAPPSRETAAGRKGSLQAREEPTPPSRVTSGQHLSGSVALAGPPLYRLS